jgi:hypothetical protein
MKPAFSTPNPPKLSVQPKSRDAWQPSTGGVQGSANSNRMWHTERRELSARQQQE